VVFVFDLVQFGHGSVMFDHRRGGVGIGSFPTLTKLFDLITITIRIGSSLISGERSREGIR
jgi:hypothetical protein